MRVSFIGLGKLGLPLACCMADGGNSILGIDKSSYVNKQLKEGLLPFYETDLEPFFISVKSKFIDFSDSFDRAIKETDVSVILVNTQLGDSGYASDLVEEVIRELAYALIDSSKEYHLVVVSSTLLPGSIDSLISIFEDISGRVHGIGFGFTYVPDFVKLGSVLKDFMNPEFVLIGSENDRDFLTTARIWNSFVKNSAPVHRLSLTEAEIAKVALNAYLVSKISFANFLGLLCKDTPNVNVRNITDVIGLDKRISPFFFRSGAPYGGTCFPRDTAAFIEFTKSRGYSADHMFFAEKVNNLILEEIILTASDVERVGILGISFKEASPVTVGSPSMTIITNLIKKGKKISAYDPLSKLMTDIQGEVVIYANPQECIDNSDLVILMHLNPTLVSLSYQNVAVIDPWKQLSN
jgi:UDPglucose 6-dehydrogenase